LWEYRSIYIAPLSVAVLILFGFLISTGHLPGKIRAALPFELALRHQVIQPYNFAALLIMGTTFIVAIFYCLDALHGERRDRSILFWKSLPVSDVTTVLAKASIPLVILPLLTFVIILVTQFVMLLLSTAVLLGNGLSVATLWTQVPWFAMSLVLFFHVLAVHGLYYAPIYGWLLLVSGWARRAAFLWAILPLLAIGVVEKIAFNTSHFAALLQSRLSGGSGSFAFPLPDGAMEHPLTHLAPLNFFTSPGLWIGLMLFAAFLAAAVRLRRYQGPI
jgi:ABC-2 type transport system permease protein